MGLPVPLWERDPSGSHKTTLLKGCHHPKEMQSCALCFTFTNCFLVRMHSAFHMCRNGVRVPLIMLEKCPQSRDNGWILPPLVTLSAVPRGSPGT